MGLDADVGNVLEGEEETARVKFKFTPEQPHLDRKDPESLFGRRRMLVAAESSTSACAPRPPREGTDHPADQQLSGYYNTKPYTSGS